MKSNVSSRLSWRGVNGLACRWPFKHFLHNLVALKLCNYRTRAVALWAENQRWLQHRSLRSIFHLHVGWHGCKVTLTQTHASDLHSSWYWLSVFLQLTQRYREVMLGSLVPSRDLNLEFWSHPLMFRPYLLHLLFMRRLLSQTVRCCWKLWITVDLQILKWEQGFQTQQEFCNEHTQMVFTQWYHKSTIRCNLQLVLHIFMQHF